jgi:predicted RNA-binding protein with TRAM domain
MANAGLRESEVINLQRKDFHFDEELLFIREGKGQKDRVVPLNHAVLKDMALKYAKDLQPDDKLFDITRHGVYGLVKRYAKRAEIERNVHPHQLRHSFAVYSLKSGVDLRSLQKMLGHSRLETTAIYLQLTAGDLLEVTRNHPLPY